MLFIKVKAFLPLLIMSIYFYYPLIVQTDVMNNSNEDQLFNDHLKKGLLLFGVNPLFSYEKGFVNNYFQEIHTMANEMTVTSKVNQEIGDIRTFWLVNLEKYDPYDYEKSFYQQDFVLKGIGNYSLVYVNSTKVTDAEITNIVENFDELIYPEITTFFGQPPDIDSNNKIILLIYDIIDGSLPNSSNYVAGFFYSLNQYEYNAFQPITKFSNEAEILNIDERAADDIATIAHEFQHLIHFKNDNEEELWLDEGASMFAELLVGENPFYEGSVYRLSFENNPDVSLTHWAYYDRNLVMANYGASFAFVVYLSEHYGGSTIIQDLVTSTKHGIDSIEWTLAQEGYAVDFKEIFRNWTIANLLDDPSINDGWYNYENISISMSYEKSYSSSVVALTEEEVPYWGTDYLKFERQLGAPFRFEFIGTENVPYLVTAVLRNQSTNEMVIPIELDPISTAKFSLSDLGVTADEIIIAVSSCNPSNEPSYSDEIPAPAKTYWFLVNPSSLIVTPGTVTITNGSSGRLVSISEVVVKDTNDYYWTEAEGAEFEILTSENMSTGITGELIYDPNSQSWGISDIDISSLDNGDYRMKYFFYNDTATGEGYSALFSINTFIDINNTSTEGSTTDSEDIFSFLTSGLELFGLAFALTAFVIVKKKDKTIK